MISLIPLLMILDCPPEYTQDTYGCAQWQGQGLCTNSLYEAFMKENCQIACGFCQGKSD